MPSTVFAVPILPGKTDAWKQAITELSGARKDDYLKSRQRHGIHQETVALQQTPHGDFAVVYMVADDLSQVMPNFASSSDPFDQWFAQTVLQGAHGMDLTQLPPTNPVIIDIVK